MKKTAIKLYRCCNTCANKYNDETYNSVYHHCSKAKECYNGFSAYSPNAEMQKQENNKP